MLETAKVTAIIWDFGNVLAGFDHYRACVKLAARSAMAAADIYGALFESPSSPCKPFAVGTIGSTDFFEAVRVAIGLRAEVTYGEFSCMWNDIFTDDGRMSRVLGLVNPGVRQCILSNTQPIHWQKIVTLPVVARFFPDPERHVLSFNVGAAKPSRAMYLAALQAVDTPLDMVGSVLFVDDVAEYCDAFRSLGGYAYRFNIATDSTESLEQALRGMGLVG